MIGFYVFFAIMFSSKYFLTFFTFPGSEAIPTVDFIHVTFKEICQLEIVCTLETGELKKG